MAEIINLNRARKARDKASAKAKAVANRASHGRSKQDRETASQEARKLDRTLDGARRETPDEET